MPNHMPIYLDAWKNTGLWYSVNLINVLMGDFTGSLASSQDTNVSGIIVIQIAQNATPCTIA